MSEIKKIKRTEFDNGLIGVAEEVPWAKKVSLVVGVKVGVVDEDDKTNGATHFNEHMLFKSNQYCSTGEIVRKLEYGGTEVCAETDYTQILFSIYSFPEKLAEAVEIIYQAAGNFSYDQKEFEKEKGVILTEIQQSIENLQERSGDLFFSTLFKGTPLEREILGTEESVEKMTKKDLVMFKRKFFVPNNMVIAASGKFDRRGLQREIKNTFARIEPGKKINRNLVIDLTNSYQQKFESRPGLKQVYLTIGFKVPNLTSPDSIQLRLLGYILGGGMSFRIFSKLRQDKGIGYGLGAGYDSHEVSSSIIAFVDGFDSKRFTEVRDIILGEFRDLRTNLISEEELQRAKNSFKSKHFDSLMDISTRSTCILEKEFIRIPCDFRKFHQYIDEVTREKILEAAQKYLTDQFTLTALVPENFRIPTWV